MRLVNDSGVLLDAELEIEEAEKPGRSAIVLHSRGGGRGSTSERNPDYFSALQLIIQRLGANHRIILSVRVDSRIARDLPSQDRTLDLSFPIALHPSTDALALRKQMTKAQVAVGQAPGAKGGNSHKRILIEVDASAGEVGEYLSPSR